MARNPLSLLGGARFKLFAVRLASIPVGGGSTARACPSPLDRLKCGQDFFAIFFAHPYARLCASFRVTAHQGLWKMEGERSNVRTAPITLKTCVIVAPMKMKWDPSLSWSGRPPAASRATAVCRPRLQPGPGARPNRGAKRCQKVPKRATPLGLRVCWGDVPWKIGQETVKKR